MSSDRLYTILSRKLSGEATSAELEELNELLKQYPYKQPTTDIIEEFWQTPVEQDKDFLEATYHLHSNRLKEKGIDLTNDGDENDIDINDAPGDDNHRKNLRLLVMALVTGAVVFAGIFFYTSKNGQQTVHQNSVVAAPSEISTKNGSRTKIQLPDGTSVWLNGNSKLVYDNQHFGETFREVTLVGEGYFDVVKNHEKPFIIHTATMDIKVVGTAFNVQCYPDEKNTETSLIRGSIEVTLKNRKDKIILKPSEKLVVSNADSVLDSKPDNNDQKVRKAAAAAPFISVSHLTRNADNAIIETAWVENKLIFSSETFEEVAFKMEKWYGMHINFTNQKIKTEKLTGSFEKETVSEALKDLQFTTRFKYKINNDTIIISN